MRVSKSAFDRPPVPPFVVILQKSTTTKEKKQTKTKSQHYLYKNLSLMPFDFECDAICDYPRFFPTSKKKGKGHHMIICKISNSSFVFWFWTRRLLRLFLKKAHQLREILSPLRGSTQVFPAKNKIPTQRWSMFRWTYENLKRTFFSLFLQYTVGIKISTQVVRDVFNHYFQCFGTLNVGDKINEISDNIST